MINPCKNCKIRSPKCHAVCPDYAYWNKLHKEELEFIARKKLEEKGTFRSHLWKPEKERRK